MYAGKDFHSLPLTPDDLELLKSILDCELNVRHITCDSGQADDLARRLIELFQAGVRTAEALREMVKAA
ncbi:hypothetical protein [Sinorhizobium fredii]|uniref:Uncharacterized protein n=1 Tax=Rhizobium fredii TaxID=380 RepID=A0A2A6M7C6_RHIFR|nr:hypothetical protein [Sinorhizobium fredii]PDT50422.1 hypothetical protein CO661_01980 [Sinorhizobium fredii]